MDDEVPPAATRIEQLLSVHRVQTRCVFTLTLSFNPGDRGISFTEFYDYLPVPGDAGREYGYGVRTPYASLPILVDFFEARLGGTAEASGELADRLTACFRDLIASGELGNDLPLRENNGRVTGWFAEAGVTFEPTDWFWFNSD